MDKKIIILIIVILVIGIIIGYFIFPYLIQPGIGEEVFGTPLETVSPPTIP